MENEQYQMIIHYLSLFLILGSIAEIVVRKMGLGVREDRHHRQQRCSSDSGSGCG